MRYGQALIKQQYNMNKKWLIILGVFVLLTLILGTSFYTLTREIASWEFIQKVGGIKIETPLETEEGFYLPIVCNVSGLDSVTIKPTNLNSALSCLKTNSTINGNIIHLKIVTGIAISENFDCRCKAVSLGDLKPGSYTVYYGDKYCLEHQIGIFTIE